MPSEQRPSGLTSRLWALTMFGNSMNKRRDGMDVVAKRRGKANGEELKSLILIQCLRVRPVNIEDIMAWAADDIDVF